MAVNRRRSAKLDRRDGDRRASRGEPEGGGNSAARAGRRRSDRDDDEADRRRPRGRTAGAARSGASDSSQVSDSAGGALGGSSLDGWLLAATALLISLGLVMVYSSSSIYAARQFGDSGFFLRRQVLWVVLGGLLAWIASVAPVERLRTWAGWIMIFAITLCLLVLVAGIGVKVGGARRWIDLGVVRFQPSEIAKLATTVLVAALLARRAERRDTRPSSLLVPVLLVQVPVVLILLEPDLGTALVIESILAIMVFGAGLRWRTTGLLGLAALPVIYHLVVGTPYRLWRILGFIDPWAYRTTVGYQITEALIAIGVGGLTGVGLGEGKQRLFFLPEAHTDFVFAILAEELGFVGVAFVLLCFGVLVWRGLRIVSQAVSPFDAYMALGMALIAVPAVINLGVATGLLPTKGLALPLISFGGSNLVATMAALGVLMAVHRRSFAKLSGVDRQGRGASA